MNFSEIMEIPDKIRSRIQVNLPFRMRDLYAEHFLALGLNPEIGLDAESLDQSSAEDFRVLAEAFRKRGRRITLHGPFMDLAPGSGDDKIRNASWERMESFLDVLHFFDPVFAVCHGGWEARRYAWMPNDWHNLAKNFWKEVAKFMRKRGCRLLLENVFEDHPEDLFTLIDDLQAEHVGCCLDTGHQAVFGSGDFKHWIKVLSPFVQAIHLHDNLGNTDDHLPPGKGNIDFAPLKTMLRTKSPLPIITLEPHKAEDLTPTLLWVANELSDFF